MEKPYTQEELKKQLIGLVLQKYNSGENNRRMEDYIRRVGYGAGGRIR